MLRVFATCGNNRVWSYWKRADRFIQSVVEVGQALQHSDLLWRV